MGPALDSHDNRGVRRAGIPAVVALASLVLSACGDSTTGPGADLLDLADPWVESSPGAEGMDPALMEAALEDAGAIPSLMSLLVVRNGRLVMEEYFRGNRADSLNDVRSVTKSVVSTLTGIALSRGHIRSLEQSLGELLPNAPYQDARQREITIWHLLKMGSGFEWSEDTGSDYLDWARSEDPVRYLLDRPIIHDPGTVFTYNSASTHLLGVVLEAVTGRPLEEFADDVLFRPLGITRRRWQPLPGGKVNGGAGLDLRPRDLARLGQLYLQEGLSGNRQLLSWSWSYEATRPHWDQLGQVGPLQALSYGYLWWTDQSLDDDLFLALGWGGQFILVQRSTGLVVVTTTAWWELDDETADTTIQALLQLIVDHVLGAAR